MIIFLQYPAISAEYPVAGQLDIWHYLYYLNMNTQELIFVGDQHDARSEVVGRGEPGPAHPRPHGAHGDRRPQEVPQEPQAGQRQQGRKPAYTTGR